MLGSALVSCWALSMSIRQQPHQWYEARSGSCRHLRVLAQTCLDYLLSLSAAPAAYIISCLCAVSSDIRSA